MSAAIVFDVETQSLAREEVMRNSGRQWDEGKTMSQAALHATTASVVLIAVAVMMPGALSQDTHACSATWRRLILCIRPSGGLPAGNEDVIVHDSEADVLRSFWGMLEKPAGPTPPCLIGFNCHHFDLPLLVQRSCILGIRIPVTLGWPHLSGRVGYCPVVDLMRVWMGHSPEARRISLSRLALVLGLGEKRETGAAFPEMWASDVSCALEYVRNDLTLTCQVRDRLFACGACP